jgi:Cu/Ag efflux pump CusA
VRHALAKNGGNLGTDGSVAFNFKNCGQFLFAPGTSEEKVIDAALEAATTRLRPVIMTAAAMVVGMVPMALGEGPGAASRAGMAKLIMGGQLLSLLLTLLIVPVISTFWDDFGVLWARWRGLTTVDKSA